LLKYLFVLKSKRFNRYYFRVVYNIVCISDCERGFSTMKRIKTENRARMKSAVLNALMTVSIEGPDIEAVDFGKMVDAWHQEKPRRTVF